MKKLTLISIICAIFNLVFPHQAKADRLAFSPDGLTLAASCGLSWFPDKPSHKFFIYDVKTGKTKEVFDYENEPNFLQYSPNGKNLYFSGFMIFEKAEFAAGGIRLFESDNIEENKEHDQNEAPDIDFVSQEETALGLAVSADGATIYRLNNYGLNVYSANNLKFLPNKSRKIKKVDGEIKEFIGISPNGQVIAEIEQVDEETFLSVQSPLQPKPFRFSVSNYDAKAHRRISVAFSHKGDILAVKDSNYGRYNLSIITVWNLRTRKMIGTLNVTQLARLYPNNQYNITDLIVSPDGKKIAVRIPENIYENVGNGYLVIWDVLTKKETLIPFDKKEKLEFSKAMTFSPDSTMLATLSLLSNKPATTQVKLWNVSTGQIIKEFR